MKINKKYFFVYLFLQSTLFCALLKGLKCDFFFKSIIEVKKYLKIKTCFIKSILDI